MRLSSLLHLFQKAPSDNPRHQACTCGNMHFKCIFLPFYMLVYFVIVDLIGPNGFCCSFSLCYKTDLNTSKGITIVV